MATTRPQQAVASSQTKSTSRSIQTTQKIPPSTNLKSFIVQLLRKHGSLTRGEITTLTGIPRTTVYDTLTNLLLAGIVEKYVQRDGRRGRPTVYYQLAVD